MLIPLLFPSLFLSLFPFFLFALYSYPISRDIADDFLTQTWFIVLLGSIIAIIVFLLGALVLFKRYQFIKQTSLGSLHGKLTSSSLTHSIPKVVNLNIFFSCHICCRLSFGGIGLGDYALCLSLSLFMSVWAGALQRVVIALYWIFMGLLRN